MKTKKILIVLVVVGLAVGLFIFFKRKHTAKIKHLNKKGKANNTEASKTVLVKPLKPKNPKQKVYVVKAGDTLGKIAKKFKTTVSELAKKNHIKNVNLIKTGQQIWI